MLAVAMHTCISTALEAEIGGFQIQGQPGLHNKTVQTNKKKEKKLQINSKALCGL